MFEELTKSFKASMYERMGSPFLSSLMIFFIIFNWKAVLIILLGQNPIIERLQEVDKNYVDATNNLYLPLLWALLYSIIFPYVSLLLFAIHNYATSLKGKIRERIEQNSVISVDKYFELNTELQKKKKEVNDLLDEKDKEIVTLEEDNFELRKQNEKLSLVKNIPYDISQDNLELFEKQSNLIVEKFQLMLSKDTHGSLIETWNRYESNIQQVNRGNHEKIQSYSLAIYSMIKWIDSIYTRVSVRNYSNYVSEFSRFLDSFVSLAEGMRSDIKVALERADGSEPIRSVGGGEVIKENWTSVREDVNQLISDWDELIVKCVNGGNEKMRKGGTRRLLPIGEGITSYEKDESTH